MKLHVLLSEEDGNVFIVCGAYTTQRRAKEEAHKLTPTIDPDKEWYECFQGIMMHDGSTQYVIAETEVEVDA